MLKKDMFKLILPQATYWSYRSFRNIEIQKTSGNIPLYSHGFSTDVLSVQQTQMIESHCSNTFRGDYTHTTHLAVGVE